MVLLGVSRMPWLVQWNMKEHCLFLQIQWWEASGGGGGGGRVLFDICFQKEFAYFLEFKRNIIIFSH